MKLFKPNFWNEKNNLISLILLPFTLIVILVTKFKRIFIKPINFNIPIICVGNIYVGGTGKTPASISIAHEITKYYKNPAIVRKFYSKHNDEYELIKQQFKHLIVRKKRPLAISEAQNNNYDTVILDDGFQDCGVKKDINIICFNQDQLIGNGMVFPSGPLRENLSSLKHANLVLLNGEKRNFEFEKKLYKINDKIKIFHSHYVPVNINQFKKRKFIAIAGIGNPINFFKLLEKNNIIIEKKMSFPDHYDFSQKEIQSITDNAKKNGLEIIMTEKDFFRLKNFKNRIINYLKISLEIKDKDNFIKEIMRIYD